jgi:DNA-directed RNA polymerase sigma subunit (sigma70/sigma32)
MPQTPEKIKRNTEILIDHHRGMVMRAIGAKHGISHERVRQILARARRRRDRWQYVEDLAK